MPLWSRRREPERPAEPDDPQGPSLPPVVADPAPAVGELACSRVGCSETTGVACQYVDRRGRRCATAWCPAHQCTIQARPYCPRHGGVVQAVIAAGTTSTPLPDIDNRAPSLVQFVAEAVTEKIVETLHASWPGDLETGVFPLQLTYLGPERRRFWSRRWTLHSHRGDEVTVRLGVAEDRSDLVLVRVDSDTVAELVPPWISHRSTADEAVRQAFFANVVEAARVAVEQAYRREANPQEFLPKAPSPSDEGT
ncbi:MAG: hypothetical protein NVSMB29_17500 [Candidatus Dormibacteria bacterium]